MMKTLTFSLPAGQTCPGAKDCKSRAVEKNGKAIVVDGPECQFRCFAASQEALLPNVRLSRQNNLTALRASKTAADMARTLQSDAVAYGLGNAKLSAKQGRMTVRIHVSGDFFSQRYFDAWLQVARDNPQTLYYAYTKSIPFWIARLHEIPLNLVLTASLGGQWDDLVYEHGLRYAKVVYSEYEAESLGLTIDHDDSLAKDPKVKSFALLLHGTQPKGSKAAASMSKLRKTGKAGYSKKGK